MTDQKGLAPLVIISVAAIVLILLAGVYILNNQLSSAPTTGPQTTQEDCSISYGGCDNDPNFYKWTDDGLP